VGAPEKGKKEALANVRALVSDAETIRNLQDKWSLPNQQSVIRYLIEKSEQVEALERQLIEKEAQIQELQDKPNQDSSVEENQQLKTELQEMTEELQTQAAQLQEQDLKAMIRELIRQELQGMKEPIVPTAEVSPKESEKPKTPKPERDWSTVSNEELWASKARGATDEQQFSF